jgi:hypothetical protein
VPPDDLEIASLRRRFAALFVDLALLLLLLVAGGVGWFKLRRVFGRRRGVFGRRRRFDRLSARVPLEAGQRAQPSQRFRVLAGAQQIVTDVAWRNWRGPGAWLFGIRRADARTGGPVTLRSAVVQRFVGQLSSVLTGEVSRRAMRENTRRMEELKPRIAEIRERHADDSGAQQRAIMELYREHKVNPLGWCAGPAAVVAPSLAQILLSRRRQSLQDRVAGVVWVRDRG